MVSDRHIGLFGATALGVGAIVGGGILALAGVAFATAGPGAIVAFALNGGIAFLTVASFAELAKRFPESGGIYAYAKKVFSIEIAFVVGWVVWFASIMAGVLYALGFAAFAAEGVGRALADLEVSSDWLRRPDLRVAIAVAAIGLYAASLLRRTRGGGNGATVGKVIVFIVLIGAGLVAWIRGAPSELVDRLSPFLVAGPVGVIQAMGYTFIALQGFDLIAAVGGEVRDPERNLPQAMYLSLGIALAIYLPLLFLLATVGAGEGGIAEAAAANPEGLVADATERFLGPAGYWLVIAAGVLSMVTALRANLLGASRVGFAMARDRSLPRRMGQTHGPSGVPAVAVAVTGAMVAAIAIAVGNVAVGGAASSLIFLIAFTIVHWAALLVRRRSAQPEAGQRRSALVPVAGSLLCLGLAAFQAIAVPEAGWVVALWLGVGGILYWTLFAPGARLADASAQARDPDLARLRGRSPLVLVPIANPASAASLVDVAVTLRTPGTGRVLLLSVVHTPSEPAPVPGARVETPSEIQTEVAGLDDLAERHPALQNAQGVLGESLQRSLEHSLVAETLFTIAPDVWREIARVADGHGCETVLVGLPDLNAPDTEARLEGLLAELDTDVVILRAPHRWHMSEARKILVPIGGRRDHSHLRARLLASLSRSGERSLTYLRTLPESVSDELRGQAERQIRALARDEAAGPYEIVVDCTSDRRQSIIGHAAEADMVVMGSARLARGRAGLGELPLAIARETNVPLVLISRRPSRSRRFPRTGFRRV
jgi:amino acid transporter/nucleotide-binding universal stress UspA family protein